MATDVDPIRVDSGLPVVDGTNQSKAGMLKSERKAAGTAEQVYQCRNSPSTVHQHLQTAPHRSPTTTTLDSFLFLHPLQILARAGVDLDQVADVDEGGAGESAPVSTLQGLVTLVAVLPFMPGSQYSTRNTTWLGGVMLIG